MTATIPPARPRAVAPYASKRAAIVSCRTILGRYLLQEITRAQAKATLIVALAMPEAEAEDRLSTADLAAMPLLAALALTRETPAPCAATLARARAL